MSMEECGHCGASFDDEEAYLQHLWEEHSDELGPIEQRRVANLGAGDDGPGVVVYGAAIGALALVGLLAYVLVFSGGGAFGASGPGASDSTGGGPHDVWSVHYHGTITATIGGEELDFSRQQFQMQADPFHFENGDGTQWHVHAKGVTLSYAMGTLGIDVTEDAVAYDGTTYGDDTDETIVVAVNGESVNPAEYVLQEGDEIRIVANASG